MNLRCVAKVYYAVEEKRREIYLRKPTKKYLVKFTVVTRQRKIQKINIPNQKIQTKWKLTILRNVQKYILNLSKRFRKRTKNVVKLYLFFNASCFTFGKFYSFGCWHETKSKNKNKKKSNKNLQNNCRFR